MLRAHLWGLPNRLRGSVTSDKAAQCTRDHPTVTTGAPEGIALAAGGAPAREGPMIETAAGNERTANEAGAAEPQKPEPEAAPPAGALPNQTLQVPPGSKPSQSLQPHASFMTVQSLRHSGEWRQAEEPSLQLSQRYAAAIRSLESAVCRPSASSAEPEPDLNPGWSEAPKKSGPGKLWLPEGRAIDPAVLRRALEA